ncbi:FAD-dependent oxidoreductase [Chloroflexota bacterium]
MVASKRFEKLLEPGRIGSVKTRNRMIKTAAEMGFWSEEELHMNETVKAFYEAIAKGGIGLLTVETPTIDYPISARRKGHYRIDDDKYIKGLSELTQVIHKHGCPTFLQLYHSGPWQTAPLSWRKTSPGEPPYIVPGPPIAASPVSINSELDRHNEVPRELTIPEIEEIVDKFASAAVRAQKAGFDGIEINAGSSHLPNSFLSPFWNRRQDAYGCGSLENRARFVTGIIREIKKRLGRDFPVSVIINGIEIGRVIGVGDSECLTSEDSRGLARILQEAGADAIHVRSIWLGMFVASIFPDQLFYPEPPISLKSFPEEYDWSHRGAGANVPLAAAMKKVLSIPVITVGRLNPELGEKVLREGKADFIGMTRRLFADPELPNKIASGRLDDIAPCTACGTCSGSRPKRCRVNAAMGKEQTYVIKQAEKRKKVMVVGGGPAGMEAARVAALRGHEVTLYEKTHKLGGLLPMAALVKGLEVECLLDLVRYLKTQIDKLGVKTELGKEVNASLIEQIKPDVVILATGGIPTIPEITGINKRNVISSPDLHRMLKFYLRFLGPRILRLLTRLWMPIGKRVVIIGGGIHGCELAEFLVKRGRKVTVVDTAETLGEGMVDFQKLYLISWFHKRGVTMMPQVKYEEITDEGLTIVTKEGSRQTIKADSIVPAMSLIPNNGLLKSLEGKVSEIYAIGDCREPNLIVDAIADGSRIARAI